MQLGKNPIADVTVAIADADMIACRQVEDQRKHDVGPEASDHYRICEELRDPTIGQVL